MSEKVQDFRGLSALLRGNQAERPGTPPANISLYPGDPDSTQLVWAWDVSYHTCRGNGTKRPKESPSETTPCRASLSTIISLHEQGSMRKGGAEA